MRKIKNSKGFTLMEMLIVVAIIAILVAIAIPTFTSSLEKAREAADAANLRAAYAEVIANYLSGETGTKLTAEVKCTQKKNGWAMGTDNKITIGNIEVADTPVNGAWTVTVAEDASADDGVKVTIVKKTS